MNPLVPAFYITSQVVLWPWIGTLHRKGGIVQRVDRIEAVYVVHGAVYVVYSMLCTNRGCCVRLMHDVYVWATMCTTYIDPCTSYGATCHLYIYIYIERERFFQWLIFNNPHFDDITMFIFSDLIIPDAVVRFSDATLILLLIVTWFSAYVMRLSVSIVRSLVFVIELSKVVIRFMIAAMERCH